MAEDQMKEPARTIGQIILKIIGYILLGLLCTWSVLNIPFLFPIAYAIWEIIAGIWWLAQPSIHP